MQEYLELFIEAVMDAFEEFFAVLTVPTTKYILQAFFVSCGFVGWSIVATVMKWFSLVSIEESVTATVMLLILVLIDSSTRGKIKSSMIDLKDKAVKKFSNSEVMEVVENADTDSER